MNEFLDTQAVLDDVVSRFWFTYRTSFAPIGSSSNENFSFVFEIRFFKHLGGPSGPTKDTGWGCMMRCGQMMLAEGYLRFFLPTGRRKNDVQMNFSIFCFCQMKIVDFRWHLNITDRNYWQILQMFIDKRHSSYSIHQIGRKHFPFFFLN